MVTVFPTHYVSGGRTLGDLEALAASLATGSPRAVRLEACGAASIHRLLAAAHRLRHSRLDMRVSDDDSPPCRVGAQVPADPAGAVAAGPSGGTTDPVERYWREVMP